MMLPNVTCRDTDGVRNIGLCPGFFQAALIGFQVGEVEEVLGPDVLEKKFAEAVRKAKETPDTGKPLRDFDLD